MNVDPVSRCPAFGEVFRVRTLNERPRGVNPPCRLTFATRVFRLGRASQTVVLDSRRNDRAHAATVHVPEVRRKQYHYDQKMLQPAKK